MSKLSYIAEIRFELLKYKSFNSTFAIILIKRSNRFLKHTFADSEMLRYLYYFLEWNFIIILNWHTSFKHKKSHYCHCKSFRVVSILNSNFSLLKHSNTPLNQQSFHTGVSIRQLICMDSIIHSFKFFHFFFFIHSIGLLMSIERFNEHFCH